MEEDFIRIYENRIPDELSDELVKWFQTTSTSGRMVTRNTVLLLIHKLH